MREQKERIEPLLCPRRRFSRAEILELLQERIRRREPILMAGAGIGIVAKMAEAGQADLITATSEDRLRMMGQPSCMSYAAVGNANDLALDALVRAARMARQTPVLCGLAPGDPRREADQLLEEAKRLGADGFIGLPASNGFGPLLDGDVRGSVLHSAADLEMLRLCRRQEIFSVAVCFDETYAAVAARAGADLIVAHAGYTAGGLCGPQSDQARTLEQTIVFTARVNRAAKQAREGVPVLCHGAALNTPQAVQACLLRAGVQGFYGGSALDRLPMEQAVMEVVGKLKQLKTGGREI